MRPRSGPGLALWIAEAATGVRGRRAFRAMSHAVAARSGLASRAARRGEESGVTSAQAARRRLAAEATRSPSATVKKAPPPGARRVVTAQLDGAM